MATIKELEAEIVILNTTIEDLRIELARYKDVTVAVEGIIHHVDTHDSTPEDLRGAIVTFKTKRAIANTKPVEEVIDPEVIT